MIIVALDNAFGIDTIYEEINKYRYIIKKIL